MPALTEILRGRTRRQWLAIGGVVLLLVGGVLAIVFATNNHPTTNALGTTTTTAPAPVTTTTGLSVPPGYCPLTDLRAPDGVPDRPALAVKVGNEPLGARPQSGLNEADIVFDTPAEGFIMRYVAVYQCHDAGRIGPNRSVRWIDWHLIRQFRNPILAFAGGIDPDVNIVNSLKWAKADNLLQNAGVAGVRVSTRVPPDNLYTSTSALYGLSTKFNACYGPPPPIFRYSAAVPAGSTPAKAAHINFSFDTDVTWTWDPSIGLWVHSYASGPDIDALTNSPVTTANVVVLVVSYRFGRHIESTGGSGDFESHTLGKGTGYILRNGRAIKVTWSRRFVTQPWTFTEANGTVVSLSPGRTWVELLPNTTAHAPGAFGITP